jgi:hypothetical protein
MALFGSPSAVSYVESANLTSAIEQGAEDAALARRMGLAEDVNRCLDGDIYDFVRDAIYAAYDKDTAGKMVMQSGVSTRINLMRDALNKVDKSWDQGAEYTLEGAEDGGGPAFKKFLAALNLDAVVKECSQMLWVHPGFCAAPMVLEDEDKEKPRRFVVRLFTPDRFSAEGMPGAPGSLECVSLFSFNQASAAPFEKLELEQGKWELYARKEAGEKWQKVKEDVHTYGIIPAVLARPNPFRLWADNYGAQLLEATVRINQAQTVLSHNSHGQGKVLVGSFQKALPNQVLAHGAIIDAPAGASLQDFSTDLEAFRRTHIDGERRMVAALFGFPADEFDGTQVPQSGEALKIRMFAAMQMALKRQEWLIRFATDLYWTALQVLATEIADTSKPPVAGFEAGFADLPPFKVGAKSVEDQDVRLVVKPREIALPSLASEVAAAEDRETALGLTNRILMAMSRNPGMTADEAADMLVQNLRIESAFKAGSVSAKARGVKALLNAESQTMSPEMADPARKALAIQYMSLAIERAAASGKLGAVEKALGSKILEMARSL